MSRAVWLIVLAELFGTALWFSGNPAINELAAKWDLSSAGKGWLLMATQLGFIVGTLGVSLSGLADAFPSHRIFAVCAALGAAANAGFALVDSGLGAAMGFRFLTGVALAGVYPLGMKLVVTWAPQQSGTALGWLVGALTLGASVPFLADGLYDSGDWRVPVLATSVMALLGAATVASLGEGPARRPPTPMNWGKVWAAFRVPKFRASAFGYFGHMWELYAFWALVPFIVGSQIGTFRVIAAGALGCVVGGWASRRVGSHWVAASALVVSGAMCVVWPWLSGLPLWLGTALVAIWGFAVVADSPQFSAMSAKYCPRDSVGSALAVQNAIGFSITLITIQTTQWVWPEWGESTVWLLAPGPLVGLLAMRPLFRAGGTDTL